MYYPSSQTSYEEFFVKDHLGNVRSVIEVSYTSTQEYLATYEVASANLENLFFETVDPVRDDKPGGSGGDMKAARLNAADPNRTTGTSMLLKVMAGDKVEMNVNNFYENYDAGNDDPMPAEDLMWSIINTLTGGIGGLPGENHNTEIINQTFTQDNYGIFHNIVKNNVDPSRPRASLNYILFDENMRIVESSSGSFQANGNGTWEEIGTTTPLQIPINGYLAIYLQTGTRVMGCLTCGDVYFDKLKLRFTRGNLKEEAHYYPHGLPIAGMGSAAQGFKENRHKYQGNEYIKDLGLNWMDFQARQYDPQIGRFMSIDPLADEGGQQVLSPYAAMGNAPESMIDPSGTIFTFGSAGLETSFKNLQAENERRMAAYATELGSLDLLSRNPEVQKRIGQINALINMHQTFAAQLKAMDESPVEFHISNNAPIHIKTAAAETFYNFEEGRVQFNMGGDNPWQPTLAHELRHGYGMLIGELAETMRFGAPLYDQMDEAEGNFTGLLFTSHPEDAVNDSYKFIENDATPGSNGTYPYLKGRNIQLSTKTPFAILKNYVNDDKLIIPAGINTSNPTTGDIMSTINDQLIKFGREPRYRFGKYLIK